MITVAIVEDNVTLSQIWSEILEDSEGYRCVGVFSSADDAIHSLPTLSADVILMDIQLSPTETGIEIIKKIKSQCGDSQFLIFTIFEDDNSISEALKAGASGYILKNTSPEMVLAAIKEIHEGGAPMSAGIARRVLSSFHTKIETTTQSDFSLHPKEKIVLELLAKGLYYKEVAEELNLTINTVKQYCHAIYKKLAVSNRTEALNKYFNK